MTHTNEQERADHIAYEAGVPLNFSMHRNGPVGAFTFAEFLKLIDSAVEYGSRRAHVVYKCSECEDTGVGISHGYDCTSCYGELPAAPQPPEAAPVQMPEPAEFQVRIRPTWDANLHWTNWEKCTPEAAAEYERTPLLHDWAYEVRKLYTEHQVRQLLAQHGIK